jgi:hypothetical protein
MSMLVIMVKIVQATHIRMPNQDCPGCSQGPDNGAMDTTAHALTRTRTHVRQTRYEGFRRSDGLWDIEVTLRDERDYESQGFERGPIPAGMPVHLIHLCVTVDDALVVQAISGEYAARPFGSLPAVAAAAAEGWWAPAWRKGGGARSRAQLGGEVGCAHIRDLLVQLAAAAYQIVPVWHARMRRGCPAARRRQGAAASGPVCGLGAGRPGRGAGVSGLRDTRHAACGQPARSAARLSCSGRRRLAQTHAAQGPGQGHAEQPADAADQRRVGAPRRSASAPTARKPSGDAPMHIVISPMASGRRATGVAV